MSKNNEKHIRTSVCPLYSVNTGKADCISAFISAYHSAVQFYINYLWNNRIEYKIKDVQKIFDRKLDILNDCPSFISTTDIAFETILSARALKSASTQACGMVKGALEKRKQLLFKRKELISNGLRIRHINRLISKESPLLPKPEVIYPELNSICASVSPATTAKSNYIVELYSLFSRNALKANSSLRKKLYIPFNLTKHAAKLKNKSNSKLLAGIQISADKIYLRYELTTPPKKTKGHVVGADQGIEAVLHLSDNQITTKCIHGHDLNSITDKIARRQKSSRGMKAAKQHRDNYIRWSVKQLKTDHIKELRLEKLSNFREKKNISKKLFYMAEPLIRAAVITHFQEAGVQIVEEESYYMSQRCSDCGFVSRKNRRTRKLFVCQRCGFRADADYNSSCNHEQMLPSVKEIFRLMSGKNREFFWKAEGLFDPDGAEFAVPHGRKDCIVNIC